MIKEENKKSTSGTVAIFGGSGFVGSKLINLLLLKNYRVKIISRHSKRSITGASPGVEWIRLKSFDITLIKNALTDVDVVINTIGILHEDKKNRFKTIHVDLVEKICQSVDDLKIRKFIHLSALKASAAHAPSDYLKSKGLAEDKIKQMLGKHSTYCIVQPSLIFGDGAQSFNMFQYLVSYFPIIPLAKASAMFAPVHVNDVAQSVYQCLKSNDYDNQVIQVYGSEKFNLKQILKLIAKAKNKKRLIIGLPDFLGVMQASFLEFIVPGKLMTRDNFKSLSIPSIGEENILESMNIKPIKLSNWLNLNYNQYKDKISHYRDII